MSQDLPPLPSLDALPALPTIGDVRRRPPPGGARREWVDGYVVAVRDETPHARSLTLGLPAGTPPHTPGQHYVVRAQRDDGSWAQRSYSVASAPARPGGPPQVQLTVERLDDGELSPWLHDLDVGAVVSVRGPFGGWFVWRGESPVLLVGGGSGVVPLMSILRAWDGLGRAGRVHLVLSVRTPDDVFYAGELAGDLAGVTTVVHTRQSPAGTARAPGRLRAQDLQDALAALAVDDEAPPLCFVCGSAAFAEHASQLLVDVGVPAGMVRVERFGPS